MTLSRSPMTRVSLTLAAACTLLLVIGCSDDGLGKRYPVSGTVTYNGENVKAGTISFYATGGPDADAHAATGSIVDGSYTLSTIGGDDGAFPGDYEVAISARNPDMSKAEENATKSGGAFRQDDVAKAYANAPSLIPKKYESTQDSGLTAKVEQGSNTIDFKLEGELE